MPRMIFNNLPSTISVGVDINEDGLVKVALAAVHPSDTKKGKGTRRVANNILNGRLNKTGDDKMTRVIGSYKGTAITQEVYGPVRDVVRKLKRRRNVDSIFGLIEKNLPQVGVDGLLGPAVPTFNRPTLEDYTKACSGESCSTDSRPTSYGGATEHRGPAY